MLRLALLLLLLPQFAFARSYPLMDNFESGPFDVGAGTFAQSGPQSDIHSQLRIVTVEFGAHASLYTSGLDDFLNLQLPPGGGVSVEYFLDPIGLGGTTTFSSEIQAPPNLFRPGQSFDLLMGELLVGDSLPTDRVFGPVAGMTVRETLPSPSNTRLLEFEFGYTAGRTAGVDLLPPRDPIYDSDALAHFELEFDVPGAPGDPATRDEFELRCEVPEGEPWKIVAIDVQPNVAEAKIAATVGLLQVGAKQSKAAGDLLQISVQGIHNTLQVTGSPGAAILDPLKMVATPSIMDAQTTLHFSRRLDFGSPVEVYGARGRLLRMLNPTAGGMQATWDGRDARGAQVGSGVYFLRAVDACGAASARVVKLR